MQLSLSKFSLRIIGEVLGKNAEKQQKDTQRTSERSPSVAGVLCVLRTYVERHSK